MKGENYPITLACDLLGLPTSSYYYKAAEVDETAVEAAIEEIAGQYPTYGTRRISQQIRRPPYKLLVNRKRARRIMAEKGLLRPVKKKKTSHHQQ